MATLPNNLGVPAPTLYQPPEEPAMPVAPPTSPLPPVWPRSAQMAAGSLLVLSLLLMGWHLLTMSVSSTRPTQLVLQLELNRADRAELRQLPGIGESLARRIDDFRRDHGPFSCVDDLRRVPGVGPATLETLRPFVTVEPAIVPSEAGEPVSEPAGQRVKKQVAAATQPVRLLKDPTLQNLIDVNTATQDQLRKLPGIGPKMSERIMQARQLRPFESVNDLRRVPGIGPKTLERLRPFVTVKPTSEKAVLAR